MKKRICALLLCLAALFSLAGCGTKPKTPVKGQNEPNPVKAQGLPEAEPGCVPLLLIYTCGEPGQPGVSILFRHLEHPAQYPDPGAAVLHRHQLRLCARRLAAGASHL